MSGDKYYTQALQFTGFAYVPEDMWTSNDRRKIAARALDLRLEAEGLVRVTGRAEQTNSSHVEWSEEHECYVRPMEF